MTAGGSGQAHGATDPGRPLYYSHPACLEHDPREYSPGHPDTPERLVALEAALQERDWLGWERRLAPRATGEQLELVHSPAHVRWIRELCEAGGGAIDADTFVGRPSYTAALHAAGGALEMTRALLAHEAAVGFCGVRPSGHHAERDRAMGFCLFDNVAVAAAGAIAEGDLRRVFVLDWDVHHGNGTAEIFRSRPDVLFASLHQSAPVSRHGAARGRRQRRGRGLHDQPARAAGHGRGAVDGAAGPHRAAGGARLRAGADPGLGRLRRACPRPAGRMSPAHIDLRGDGLPCARAGPGAGVPLGLVLEGGYDRDVLAECVCAIMPALAGDGQAPAVARLDPEGPAAPLLARALERISRHWPVR